MSYNFHIGQDVKNIEKFRLTKKYK